MLNKIKADGPCWAVYDKQPMALQHRWVGAAGKGAGSTTYSLHWTGANITLVDWASGKTSNLLSLENTQNMAFTTVLF